MNIKKQLLIILFGLLGLSTFAQTNKKTLNYQAVILDPKAIDIPGASITGQPLNKGNVCLRFSLLNTQGGLDYEETQQVTTDEYGLVNVSIGTGTQASSNSTSIYKSFDSVVWISSVKSLKVSVSFDGCSSFKQVSSQALNYTPYALYAEAVDYKNVREAPTKLSQFSNDAGYLIPKDLDPLKSDIQTNSSKIEVANKSIADNKKISDATFLVVNQSITSLDTKVADNKKSSDATFLVVNQSITSLETKLAENTTAIKENTSSITNINTKITDQQNQISDNRNQIAATNNTMNAQIGGLQGQINNTNNTVSNLTGVAEMQSNKSTATNLGGVNPSDQAYPSQKAAKAYVDQVVSQIATSGVPDATTLAAGKVQLAGDLGGTATNPTVPALAGKENTANKSTNVQTDGTNDTKYPSVKAVKDYVDQATLGTALAADLAAKANLASPTFSGTPILPSGTTGVTQTSGDNSTKLATTAYVDAQLAAGAADATTSTKGIVKLTGDLGGTATNPTVPGLALKANTTDVTTSLALKEDVSNKSNAALGTSTTLYPTQNAVKTYVDAQVSSATIVDADATTRGKIQLAGDLAGTASSPTVPGLALKANTSDITTSLALKEDVSNKSNAALGTSTTLYPTQSAVKTYVDAQVASATIVDADATTRGKIQLAGDLAGTASSPTVPGLALKANTSDVTTSLATKEDASNKSNAALGTSTTLFPTQNAVKTYVDAQFASATIADADATTKGKLQLTGDLAGSATSPSVVKLRGTPISSVAPTTAGHVLTYDVNGSATWAAPANSANTISGVVPVANGGTGLSSVTNGGAVYASSSSALTTGTLPLTAGGTGVTTQQAAINALTGTQTSGGYLRSDGTDARLSTIQAADVPTLNQNTTGNAGNVTGTVAVANGGTGATNAAAARTNLGLVIGTNVMAANATTADITPSTNKNYVTDVQAGVLSNTSGINSGDETTNTIKTKLGIATLIGSNTGDQTISLTGDLTGTGTGTITATLTNSGVTAGSYGDASSIPTFTVDTKGRLTSVGTVGVTSTGVPYSGATMPVNLGNFDLVVNGISVGKGAGSVFISNTIIGSQALSNNTWGSENIAIGKQSSFSNIEGGGNVSIGDKALYSNTIGSMNIGIGKESLYSNTASSNIATGWRALYNNTSGSGNIAIGHEALGANTIGSYNIGIGSSSNTNTNGSFNVYIGGISMGTTNVNKNTAIGYGSRIDGNYTNASAIGYGAGVFASNTVVLGDANITHVYSRGAYSSSSDKRIKKNIEPITYGLNTILKLRPVKFTFTQNNQIQIGFIAQEIKQVMPEVVSGIEGDLDKGEILSVSYPNIVAALTKALQEEDAKNEQLKKELKIQKDEIKILKRKIELVLKKITH